MLLRKYMKKQDDKRKAAEKPADEDELESTDEEETKKDNAVGKLLNGIRNKMIERGLVGDISINRLNGVLLTSASCDVHAADAPMNLSSLCDEHEMSPSDVKALNMSDAAFKNLVKRSAYWDGFPYSPDMVLGRGFEIGFYLPILITVGYFISVNINATVESLSAYRIKLEEKKKFEKALSTSNEQYISELQNQGISLVLAQKAVIATQSESVEAALVWAIAQQSAIENIRNSAALDETVPPPDKK